jgi:hypothetical protein
MKLFHITDRAALPAILREGLLPQLGARSTLCGETIPAVFVFVALECCEDALMNWVGEAFPEDELVVLELNYAPRASRQDVDYELSILERIPPEAISRVLDENLEPLVI